MSSGFVSAGTSDNPPERDDEWVKAQEAVEAARRRKAEEGRQDGGKSLFETLQANKTAKQEAFEESIRLKNQFRSLDEDEVEFLDSVLESTRAKEAEVKKDTQEQLEMFRRQREEAEKALLSQNNTDLDATGAKGAEEEIWSISAKKRKKGKDAEVFKGVKLRKSSSAADSMVKPKPLSDDSTSRSSVSDDTHTAVERKQALQSKNRDPPDPSPTTAMGRKTSSSATATATATTGLGLGDYNSDDE